MQTITYRAQAFGKNGRDFFFLVGLSPTCYPRSCYSGLVFRCTHCNPYLRTIGCSLYELSSSCDAYGKRWKTSTSTRRPTAAEVQAALRTLNVTLEMDKASWKGKYHTLVKRYHPDAGGDVDHMTRVTVAYDTLLQLTPHEKESYASLLHPSKGDIRELKKQWTPQKDRTPGAAKSGARGRPSSSTPRSSYSYAFTQPSWEADSHGERRRGFAWEGDCDEEEVRQHSSSLYAFVHRRWQQDYFWRNFARSRSTSMPNDDDDRKLERKKSLFSHYFAFSTFSPITRDSFSSFFVFIPRWNRFCGWRRTSGRRTNDSRREKGSADSWYSESHHTSASSQSKKPLYPLFSVGMESTPYHSFYFGMRSRQRARLMSPTAILTRGIVFLLFLLSVLLLVVRFFRDRNQAQIYLPAAANVSRHERLYALYTSTTHPYYQKTATEEVMDSDYSPPLHHNCSPPSLLPSAISAFCHDHNRSVGKAQLNGDPLSVLLSTDSHQDDFSSCFRSRKEMLKKNEIVPERKHEEHLKNVNEDEEMKGKGDGTMTRSANNNESVFVTTSSECKDHTLNCLPSRKERKERVESKGYAMEASSTSDKSAKSMSRSIFRAQNLFRQRKLEAQYYHIAIQHGWPTVRTTSCFAQREAGAVHGRNVHLDADKETSIIDMPHASDAENESKSSMGVLPASGDSFVEPHPCLLSSRYGDVSPLYHGYIAGMMIFFPYPQAPSDVLVGDEGLY